MEEDEPGGWDSGRILLAIVKVKELVFFCEMQSSEVKIIDEQRGNGDSFYRHIFYEGRWKIHW